MRPVPQGAGGSLSFGAYLRQSRVLRGLSVAEVAKATRLPQKLVDGLENDDVSALTDRAYALLAARSCAAFIGLDPDDTALRLEEQIRLSGPPRPSRSLWEQLWSRRPPPAVWILVLLTVLACALLFLAR